MRFPWRSIDGGLGSGKGEEAPFSSNYGWNAWSESLIHTGKHHRNPLAVPKQLPHQSNIPPLSRCQDPTPTLSHPGTRRLPFSEICCLSSGGWIAVLRHTDTHSSRACVQVKLLPCHAVLVRPSSCRREQGLGLWGWLSLHG